MGWSIITDIVAQIVLFQSNSNDRTLTVIIAHYAVSNVNFSIVYLI